MANKKDFSQVNTNSIYSRRDDATAEPLPGQLAFKGNEGEIAPLEQTKEEQLQAEIEQVIYDSQLANCRLPDDAPEQLKKDRAEARAKLGLPDDTPKRRNKKRKDAGMVSIYTYLTAENLDYLETMATLYGVTRQTALNDILEEDRKNSPIYEQALELRKKARKGK